MLLSEENVDDQITGGKRHFHGIDLLKGLLIIGVILINSIRAGQYDSIYRYMLASMTIPLFIGISGFLVKEKFLKHASFSVVFKKYFFRMILPWIIASIVYFFILNYNVYETLDIKDIIFFFISPYNHLWFIPALFGWILVLWILLKFKMTPKDILVFSILFTIFWVLVIESNLYTEVSLLDSVFSKFRFKAFGNEFLFFFVGFWLGCHIRDDDRLRSNHFDLVWIFIILIPALFLFRIFYFYNFAQPFYTIDYYMFNVSTIVCAMFIVKDRHFNRVKILKWVGKQSLPFYLYHVVIVIITVEQYNNRVHVNVWYLITYSMMLLLIPIIFFLSRIGFVDRYIFGNVKR